MKKSNLVVNKKMGPKMHRMGEDVVEETKRRSDDHTGRMHAEWFNNPRHYINDEYVGPGSEAMDE
jgi:hypothetical protein